MREAWTHIFAQANAWKPDVLVISAGFDAHQYDPLGKFNWTYEDYTWLGQEIQKLAKKNGCGTLSILEGGYELNVLENAGKAYVKGLL